VTALDIDRIRAAFPGRRIDYYASVDSTMRAAVGLEAGSVVLAEEQTAGQGRLGRTWHSEAGAGIYCSMALRPMPALTLALGLAAQSAILEATGLMCDIRWPNDLLLGGKKVAGILVHGADGVGICGIGINVGHTEFPAELEGVATSLRIELNKKAGGPANDAGTPARPTWGRMPSCAAIANRRAGRLTIGPQVACRPTCPTSLPSSTEIVVSLLKAIDRFASLGKDEVLRLFTQSSSYACGRRVRVEQPNGAIEGTTAGLDPSGFLIVRKDDGTDTLVLAGGVRAAGS
jgi:BirA family biotin operon repressor/biotin-[acetyl-CoA-carboxylase] ligase